MATSEMALNGATLLLLWTGLLFAPDQAAKNAVIGTAGTCGVIYACYVWRRSRF